MSEIRLIHGDCLKVLPKLSKAVMVFADPPDNIGCKYKGFTDRWDNEGDYLEWLFQIQFEVIEHTRYEIPDTRYEKE